MYEVCYVKQHVQVLSRGLQNASAKNVCGEPLLSLSFLTAVAQGVVPRAVCMKQTALGCEPELQK